MAARFKWYGFPSTPELLRTLGKAMLQEQYGAERPVGFRMFVARRDELVGRLVHRHEYVEEVEDPLGERLAIPRVEFRQVSFRLSSQAPLIQVSDSTRDVRLLFERLAAFGASAPRPLTLDIRQWLRHLERRHGPARVLAARLTNLTLSATAAASVVLKGTQDVRAHMEELLQGRTGTVDRLHVDFKQRSGTVSLELARDARAVIHEGGDVAGLLAAEALVALTSAGTPVPKASTR